VRASELALEVARAQPATPDGVPVPRAIRPLLRFRGRRLSTAALTTIRQVLDGDEQFRGVVAAEATEQEVGRAGWLFLHRPEGWSAELAAIVAAEEDLVEQDRERALERSAERRVEQLDELVSQLRDQLSDATTAAERAVDELEAERGARRQAERDSADLRRRLDRAEQARRDGVADLVEARRLADERLGALRGLERRVADLESTRDCFVEPVTDALERADDTLSRLRADLDDARALLRRGPDGDAGPDAPVGPDPGRDPDAGRPGRAASAGPRSRRTPIRLERGAVDDTFEATDQLLRTPDVQVVVDGYNVSMEGWPHLDARTQRDRLVGLLSGVAARAGARIQVVFDGDDDGRRPSVGAALAVRVHYTPVGVEADDVVIEMVGRLPSELPVVVVSSDRRVRDGARASGANVVSSAALLEWDRR